MASWIERPALIRGIDRLLRSNPVVMLLGPRQCGKTTLARQFQERRRSRFGEVDLLDLEDPGDARRLDQPMTALEPLRGLVVIDEAQLKPDLFPVLRVLADRDPLPARFLLLGSASPDLTRKASESLAGRVAHLDMAGFDLSEVGSDAVRSLWLRGGFPRSFLAKSDADSLQWREDFIRTFLERDLRLFGVHVSAHVLRRFWNMAAHYHGQVWNSSEIARSLGEAHTTVKRHLDILTGAMVIRQLPPWFESMGKRQVKSPKVYVRDSGLLHSLLGISSFASLESHPKLGASWEGFAVEEVLRVTGDREAYFWATQSGAELDLLVFREGKRFGFEFKYADAPALTKSMHIARQDLRLDRLFVVVSRGRSYPLADWAEVVGPEQLRARISGSAPDGPKRAPPRSVRGR